MTQLFPAAPVYLERAYVRGVDFEANEGETSIVRAAATGPIAINDTLHFFLNVPEFTGETTLRVYHGTALVGTIAGSGLFQVDHLAISNADYFEFVAGGPDAGSYTIRTGWPSITV